MNPPDPCRCLPGLDTLAHELARRAVRPFRREVRPFLLVDATAGNGYDTCFLARLAGEQGRVAAFDVQEEALNRTARQLEAEGLAHRVRLFHDSHEKLAAASLPDCPLLAVLFNLGFLPGSDKSVNTRAAATLAALESALGLLHRHGVISVHAYTGQDGGLEEVEALRAFTASLPWKEWRVFSLSQLNKPRRQEWLFALERIV